jgi:hypothetical protein
VQQRHILLGYCNMQLFLEPKQTCASRDSPTSTDIRRREALRPPLLLGPTEMMQANKIRPGRSATLLLLVSMLERLPSFRPALLSLSTVVASSPYPPPRGPASTHTLPHLETMQWTVPSPLRNSMNATSRRIEIKRKGGQIIECTGRTDRCRNPCKNCRCLNKWTLFPSRVPRGQLLHKESKSTHAPSTDNISLRSPLCRRQT